MFDIPHHPPLGAIYTATDAQAGYCQFTVWAPQCKQVELKLCNEPNRVISMQSLPSGYWQTTVESVKPGDLYCYRLDQNRERPDPASHCQPQGVHHPSAIVDHQFEWHDQNWRGITPEQLIFYELHVGTFTTEGTLTAAIDRLPSLKELGVTAIEIMPIAQFPGERNWGYDGVYPFAVQNSYGGSLALKKFIDISHQLGLAVFLDVVYNHLGPEGNYLWDYGPYFTQKYQTPWGSAVNFDGAGSDGVRHYFYQNAWYWLDHYHCDGLRLDAVHAIHDDRPQTFLEELSHLAKQWSSAYGKYFHLIAESNQNAPHLTTPLESGGVGLTAQWSDDFHHALHVLCTGEQQDYYQDFKQPQLQLAKAIRCGFAYTGEYSVYRQRRHGMPALNHPTFSFLICSQNHDQIGNRALGERLSQLVEWEKLKLAAGLLLLTPFTPLIFMGEEYGETAPFCYFISHQDTALIEAVRQGRAREFPQAFAQNILPDPQSQATFEQCKLHWDLQNQGKHRILRNWYSQLIRLRKNLFALQSHYFQDCQSYCYQNLLIIQRQNGMNQAMIICNLEAQLQKFQAPTPSLATWTKVLDSTEARWYCKETKPDWAKDDNIEEVPNHLTGATSLMLPAYGIVVYTQKGI